MKVLVYLSVLLTLLISGCTEKQAQPVKKEIEFWTIQLSGFSGYIDGVIEEYEKLHPDVKIKWVDIPFAEAEKRALASLLSRDLPDLINMNPDFGSTLASKGALLNIKPLISKQDYEKYVKQAWLASSIDEVVFGVPWYMTSAVTIQNKAIYDGEAPKAYQELKNIAAGLDKYVLMPTLTENGKMLKIFNKYDISIVNEGKTKALFNTPKAAEVLRFWKEMYEKGYIPRESITESHRQSLEKFMAGETAFIEAGENFLNIIKENAPQVYKNITVSAQLKGSNNKTAFSVMNLVIPKKSSHPKEALNFALFLTNEQNQLKFSKLTNTFPSIQKVYPLSEELVKPLPTLRNRKDLFEIIDYMTQEVILGYKTPEQGLNDAVILWNQILAED